MVRQFATKPPLAVQIAATAEWSIGIYSGESPFELAPVGLKQPVISKHDVSDVSAGFVADPFMIRASRNWYMFFEVINNNTEKGEIGLAVSDNGLNWTYRQIVLAEPYHLSYPYVFEWQNEFYMIPESYQAGGVRLYKATEFPTKWSFAGTLRAGPYYVDSSILRYDGKWWLFTDASPDARHDMLRLFWAETLTGIWVEHPLSPIIAANPQIARPAGRLIMIDGRAVRFAQSCYPVYGTEVRAFEITDLTTTTYREREIGRKPVIGASGSGWNMSGMHHIDAHLKEDGRWLACVDGFTWKDNPSSIS
jgi:hypothetical protein